MAPSEQQAPTASSRGADRVAEVELLRSRVAAVEAELAEVRGRANAAIAAARAPAYWLECWQLDLNELMRRPGASQARGLVRAVRSGLRVVRRAKRSLRR